MVGWWPGDGNSNDVIGANNGSFLGSSSYATGEVGQAFSFNGTTSVVRIPDAAALNPAQLTLEAWVRFDSLNSPNSTDGLQYLVFKRGVTGFNNGFPQNGSQQSPIFESFSLIKVRNSGVDVFGFEVSSTQDVNTRTAVFATTSISTGQFYHVAATYDGDNMKIYVNGTLEGTQANTFAIGYAANPLMFGTTGEGFDRKLTGRLDEVGLYNRALSASEIQAISSAGTNGKCKQTITCSQPPSGLVSWWSGDGNTTDLIGTNNGSFNGSASYASAINGQGFAFDGTNSVQVADSASIKPTNVTVEAWVKFNNLDSLGASASGLQYIVFKKNSRPTTNFEAYNLLKLRSGGQDQFKFYVTNSAGTQIIATSITSIVVGQFYHIAGTYDGSTAKLYVNGVLEGQASGGSPIDYGTSPLFFGTSGESYDGKLIGVLDEVGLYNRALSATEIQAINNAGVNGKCKGLDLGITLGHTGTPTANQNVTYNMSVTNVGNVKTTSTITVTDTLPAGTTYVSTGAGTDSGWSCGGTTTVTCTNTNQMAPGSTSLINLIATETGAGSQTNTVAVSISGDVNSTNNTATDNFGVVKPSPTINWSNPADLSFGTVLSGTQLNATATFNSSSVAGTFVYTPPAGSLLNLGNQQTLSVTFTPTDTATYASATATVSINVVRDTANDITYAYDKLGRLSAVVDASGNAAIYNYDAVGNLLSIVREDSTHPSIFGFVPDSGPVGATVTISGHGFSTSTSGNSVSFHGTAATVVSASANQLQATVPSGATDGPITVISPAGTATSSNSFKVATSAGSTSITGFSPSIGGPGTFATVNGANFGASPTLNQLRFNINGAAVNSVSGQISMNVTVPFFTGSGRISLSTPFGSATSADDFYIPPNSIATTDISDKKRINIGDTLVPVAVSNTTKYGMVIFDAIAGQRVSCRSTNGYVQLYDVENRSLTGTNTTFTDAVTLSVAGTYTILVKPVTNGTSPSLDLYNVPDDVSGQIGTDGTPVQVNITQPGQDGNLTFSGTAGQRVSLYVTNVTVFSQVYLIPPGGQVTSNIARSGSLSAGDAWFSDFVILPANGTYSVFVETAPIGATGGLSIALYNVPADPTAYLTACSPSATAALTAPGQSANFSFGGVQNQLVSMRVSGPGVGGVWTLFDPDGNSSNLISNSGFIGPLSLSKTGIYRVQFHSPLSPVTGNVNVTLFYVPSEVIGTISINGSPVTVVITAPGQSASLTFSGTINQVVSLNIVGLTLPATSVSIIGPSSHLLDGNGNVSNLNSNGWAGGVAPGPFTLPSTGDYTITIDPVGANTGYITLTLTSSTISQNTLSGSPSKTVAIVLQSPTAAPFGICTDSQKTGQELKTSNHSTSWALNIFVEEFLGLNRGLFRAREIDSFFVDQK